MIHFSVWIYSLNWKDRILEPYEYIPGLNLTFVSVANLTKLDQCVKLWQIMVCSPLKIKLDCVDTAKVIYS